MKTLHLVLKKRTPTSITHYKTEDFSIDQLQTRSKMINYEQQTRGMDTFQTKSNHLNNCKNENQSHNEYLKSMAYYIQSYKMFTLEIKVR